MFTIHLVFFGNWFRLLLIWILYLKFGFILVLSSWSFYCLLNLLMRGSYLLSFLLLLHYLLLISIVIWVICLLICFLSKWSPRVSTKYGVRHLLNTLPQSWSSPSKLIDILSQSLFLIICTACLYCLCISVYWERIQRCLLSFLTFIPINTWFNIFGWLMLFQSSWVICLDLIAINIEDCWFKCWSYSNGLLVLLLIVKDIMMIESWCHTLADSLFRFILVFNHSLL